MEIKAMYANSLVRRCLTVAAVVVLAGWTRLSPAQEPKAQPPKPKDIVDVAKGTSELKMFSKLLESAGLVDTLKGVGPYTVFAPTDEAFNKLGKRLEELQKPANKAELLRILKHHVISGRKTAADVKAMKAAKTLAGVEVTITVKGADVTVDKAKITKADMPAGNGLIHVVDAVVMPPEEPEEQP